MSPPLRNCGAALTRTEQPVRTTNDQDQAEATERSGRLHGRLAGVDWTYEILYLLCVLAAIALALSLAGRRPGWFTGQTPPDPLLVQIYAAHFRHGDFFPVWSSSDAYGMGSPAPLFYEPAFFMVGGLVFIILGGALKATMISTIAIFMVVGAYGMRKALGVVTESRMLRSVGSIGFLLTNWAFAEWLVRVELAEFAAFMIVPWLIYCCLLLIRDRRLSWLIIPIMVVLTLTHNVMTEISGFLIAITGSVFLVVYGLPGLRAIMRRLIVSASVIAVVLAPEVIAQLKMSKSYDATAAVIYANEFDPIPSFSVGHPWQYFLNPSYHWLSNTNHQIVPYQLDLTITILLIVGAVTLLVVWLRKAIRHKESELPRVNRAVVVVLAVSFLVYMFFQLGISISIYKSFWQLDVIGFPFRMMTFAVPLALILAIVVADWYLRFLRVRLPRRTNFVAGVLAALWLASFVWLSPIYRARTCASKGGASVPTVHSGSGSDPAEP